MTTTSVRDCSSPSARALRQATEPGSKTLVSLQRRACCEPEVIIDYKVGNLHNLKNALDYLKLPVAIVEEPEAVRQEIEFSS